MAVGNLAGVAHATAAVRLLAGRAPGPVSIGVLLDELTAQETLAEMLQGAVVKHTTADGRVDTRDVAATVIAAMMPAPTGKLEELVDNATAITALARLLTEAFDLAVVGGQGLNFNAAAQHVLLHMRGSQR